MLRVIRVHVSSRGTQIQSQTQIMSIHARQYLHEIGCDESVEIEGLSAGWMLDVFCNSLLLLLSV